MKRLGLFLSILLVTAGITWVIFGVLPRHIKEDPSPRRPATSAQTESTTDTSAPEPGGEQMNTSAPETFQTEMFGRLDADETVAGYTIRIYVDENARASTLRILKNAEGLVTLSVPFPGSISLAFDEAVDLTGDDIPELVVATYTGGAHCCWVYDIYSLGTAPRKLASIEAGSGTIGLEDINLDDRYEIGMTDTTFAYWEAPFSDSPAVEVVLEWNGRKFALAPRFMKKPPPGFAEIQEELAAVRARFDDYDYDLQDERWRPVPPMLWGYMLELIYTGNGDMAFSFFEDAWPEDKPGKEVFLAAFKNQLRESPFHESIKDMNGWN